MTHFHSMTWQELQGYALEFARDMHGDRLFNAIQEAEKGLTGLQTERRFLNSLLMACTFFGYNPIWYTLSYVAEDSDDSCVHQIYANRLGLEVPNVL